MRIGAGREPHNDDQDYLDLTVSRAFRIGITAQPDSNGELVTSRAYHFVGNGMAIVLFFSAMGSGPSFTCPKRHVVVGMSATAKK